MTFQGRNPIGLYSDVVPIVTERLSIIYKRPKKAIPKTKDAMTVYHLKYLYKKIGEMVRKEAL